MERLTLEGGVCVQAYTDFCDEQKDCLSCPYGDRSFVRLAAYEDTGLTPERVQKLAQAEKDGRLVVLPRKTVYIPTWDAGEKCDLACPVSVDGECGCELCEKASPYIYEKACRQEHIDQIGKTVFLTREEAEAALAKRKECSE